ncbi:BRCT domain-containing protein [Oerskovia merdavium]|uniref:BRCT domain-containing protein n=1 Tax=Oerskovia merdavium TaxID=2762227 RepID=A0ABR8TWQ4_9CELL|nr:hypothetical protein [Oerskovia merdavium]MBD7980221.1 hypothetical protein [Oerskovia merdavium]
MRDELVLFTGRALVCGEHMERRVLREHTVKLGGRVAPDRSASVTVLVVGEIWTGPLRDGQRRYSQKLVYFEELMRRQRRHVHVIDGSGFGELLTGRHARCHDLLAP